MAETTNCPKCGGATKTVQLDNVSRKECVHFGPLAWGTNVKTGKPVSVLR